MKGSRELKNGTVHFWDLSNNFVILEDIFLDNLIQNFFVKYSGIAEGSRISGIPKTNFGRILRREKKLIRIKSLLKFINILDNISLQETEKNIIWIGFINSQGIINPKLPFDFNSRYGSRFLASIANDGWISDGAYYSNSSKSLRESVRNDALSVFGGDKDAIKEWIKEDDQYLSFPSVIRDVLIKLTEFKGVKSENDPPVPSFIFNDKEFMCGWIEQTIADEGHIIFYSEKSRRSINWRRAFDVIQELSNFTFNKDEISTRQLSEDVKKIVSFRLPNLIKDECKILSKLNISYKVYNLGIYITKKKKIRTRFEIYITKRENLLKFRDLVIIPDEAKENKFSKMIHDYRRYKNP